MRKILMPAILALCLQVNAQETLCDLTYTVGTQGELEVAAPITGNGLPIMAPIYMTTFVGELVLGEDSCFSGPCTHVVNNSINADTITTCIDYSLTDASTAIVDTLNCCLIQVWDSTSQTWERVSEAVGIEELEVQVISDNRVYDLRGRELFQAPIGQIYIQNRKQYFRFQ
jgi:hypothetical protein